MASSLEGKVMSGDDIGPGRWLPDESDDTGWPAPEPAIWPSPPALSPYKKHKNSDELEKEVAKVSKLSAEEKKKLTDKVLIEMLEAMAESDESDVTIDDALETVKALMLLKYGGDFAKRYTYHKDRIIAKRVKQVHERNVITPDKKFQDKVKTPPDYLEMFLKFWITITVLGILYMTALLIQEKVWPESSNDGLQMPVQGTANTHQAEASMILRYKQIWPSGN